EQADAETVATRRIGPLKGFKDLWQILGRNTHPRVVYIDADVVFDPPAADQDAPARFRIFYGITLKVAQDTFEKHRVAHDRSPRSLSGACRCHFPVRRARSLSRCARKAAPAQQVKSPFLGCARRGAARSPAADHPKRI